jgi:hypothetical protein
MKSQIFLLFIIYLVHHNKEEEMDRTVGVKMHDPENQSTRRDHFGALRIIIYLTTHSVARLYTFEGMDNALI